VCAAGAATGAACTPAGTNGVFNHVASCAGAHDLCENRMDAFQCWTHASEGDDCTNFYTLCPIGTQCIGTKTAATCSAAQAALGDTCSLDSGYYIRAAPPCVAGLTCAGATMAGAAGTCAETGGNGGGYGGSPTKGTSGYGGSTTKGSTSKGSTSKGSTTKGSTSKGSSGSATKGSSSKGTTQTGKKGSSCKGSTSCNQGLSCVHKGARAVCEPNGSKVGVKCAPTATNGIFPKAPPCATGLVCTGGTCATP
jgi:hypothetical protein